MISEAVFTAMTDDDVRTLMAPVLEALNNHDDIEGTTLHALAMNVTAHLALDRSNAQAAVQRVRDLIDPYDSAAFLEVSEIRKALDGES